ncbi:helix-turn-helix domain-containing protein [Actinomycetospora endophytica]|uniref:Helix-turn-helix domain-containing protein n=1 Tax=Actinomycetospora endophytica TaxID=2291215 RepID=A0ABS8PBQ4_9PSEU|nr:helix-turn-helix domain-containing protein [Actinomycetospora endophytica]MCD2195715.1 helix-turn-helix domain-containing protein [Actinomycetospora endophytica]
MEPVGVDAAPALVPAPRVGCPVQDLLTTVPDDPSGAATAVERAASEIVGGPVSVRTDGLADGPRCVRSGPVGLTWTLECPRVPAERRLLLEQACVWLRLVLERDRAATAIDDAAEETTIVTDVVEALLSVHDVDQLLLSIADRTLGLLDADICGVLLREGEEVRMRSCVGHRVIDTARLRMRRGQGVAGLVFETGKPAKVDRYVEDRTISRDFVGLAEREQTESALAVPLELPGEFLGVLEVWRRRPSVFSEQDVRRMVTLANFATIALRSARLHDEQVRANAGLEKAHAALKHQVGVLGRTAELQQALLTTVLEGGGLPAVARQVAAHLQCRVGIYDAAGTRLAVHGGDGLPDTLSTRSRSGRSLRRVTGLPTAARLQPVYADGDEIGCVCLLPGSGGESSGEEMLDAVAAQVAMACSLTLLRERVASRARREALNEVLWDLLQGPPEHRVAARARAQQMGVTLGSRLRVLHGHLENVEELASAHGWDTSRTDRLRRDVVRALRDREDGPRLALVGRRGDLVVAVAESLDAAGARSLVHDIVASCRAEAPGLRSSWGVSRPHDDAEALPNAFNEAKTALSASHRLGGDNVFLYEELGVVRLLLGSGSDPDLQTFIEDVTGPLVAYDRDNDGSLVRTLRAFFDADCSQRAAAEKLFVHHKTLRYRLERIKQLTGLDLSRHDDRMRADVALRLLQLNGE